MNINITGSAKGSNKGSVSTLTRYLEKENRQRISKENRGSVKELSNYLEKENTGKAHKDKEWFFSQDKNHVSAREVTQAIDTNKSKLKHRDAKFYLVNISPSQKELAHIGNDPEKLKAYARSVMDGYARNFNRDITGKDLLYFAKIEYERRYKGFDHEVKAGLVKQGELKPGLQTHIHVIVSRKDRYNQRQFSPLSKHQNTQNGPVRGGFPRKAFYIDAERRFDAMFNYPRSLKERFEYRNTMKYGTMKEKLQLKKQLERAPAPTISKMPSGKILKRFGRAIESQQAIALEREVIRSSKNPSFNQEP